MKQHTLLLDANFFLYSRLFVLPGGTVTKPLLSDEKSRGVFMRKLATDFSSEIRKMSSFVNRVVVCKDARSWRKDMFPDAEYKGTRTKNETIDWENVFKIFDEFEGYLKKLGIEFIKTEGAEADDLIYAWRSELNSNGENVIIWSGDKDLMQLVCYLPSENSYTLWYDSVHSKLGVYPGFIKWLESINKNIDTTDIFSMDKIDPSAESLNNFIKNHDLKVIDIFADEFVFHKILTGDKSDNVPAVVTWEKTSKTGVTRNYSLSEKMSQKVLEKFKKELNYGNFITPYFFNEECINDLVFLIKEVVNRSTSKEIQENLNRNIKLMLLNPNTIPQGIQNDMFEQIEKMNQFDHRIDFVKIVKMQSILEGTKYINSASKNDYAPSQYDPFSGFDLDAAETKDDTDDTISKLF